MTKDPTRSERRRADALTEMGRHAEAVPLYKKLAEKHPEEESHRLALAWALYNSGRGEEALECFERLYRGELARKVFTGFAYDELVRICREKKDWKRLVSVCEQAAAAQPEDIGVFRTLGEAYLDANRAVDARRIFEKLTSLEPQAPEHWCSLGNAFLAAGDSEGAEASYTRATEIDPDAASTFLSRYADVCLNAGLPEQARRAWMRCLALCPGDPLYWMGLGDVLILLGKADAAEEIYRRAASLNPAAAGSCWHRMGNLLMREGRHALAAEAFIRAAAAEPETPHYLLRLAASYAASGLDDLASEALGKAQVLFNIGPHP